MAAQTIEVQQEQSLAVYGPAVITIEVGNKFAVSPDSIHLSVCYRDVDYCDLSVTDAKALIAALQAAVGEIERQARSATAEAVPWAYKQHPPAMTRIAKCGKCQRPIAFADDAELLAAGWQHPNTSARWVCPACKVANG